MGRRYGRSVIGLVTRACTNQPGRQLSGNGGASVLEPHERAIARSKQKLRIHQRREQRITGSLVKSPEALGLRRRQAKPRHFDVLALNPSKHVVKGLLWCCHVLVPFVPFSAGVTSAKEQPMCHDRRLHARSAAPD
jgi:hypothetical protein